jgi:hypothetical protein
MKIFLKSTLSVMLFALLLFSTGCNKWLDINPDSGIIRENFWKSEEDVESAVIGCYSSLLESGLAERLLVWGDLRGDMVAPNGGCPEAFNKIISGDIISTNAYLNYSTFYKTINYCNTVLKYAKEVTSYDAAFTETDLKAAEAEALAIRSLMYFYLVRTFRNVPLVLTPTDNDRVDLFVKQSSDTVILQQILNDLATAQKGALTTYGKNSYNKGRFTRWGVEALQADVYLWCEKYDSCILACEDIIANSGLGLYEATSGADVNWYYDVFAYGNSAGESIFELQFSTYKLNPYFSYFDTKTGKYLMANSAVSDYFTKDESDSTDIRCSSKIFTSDNFVSKYQNWGFQKNSEKSYQHWLVYRFAEVYLMDAEARAVRDEGSDLEIGLSYIRKLRKARCASPATAESPESGKDLLQYVMNERYREFLFEGKRWFDILRYVKRDFANNKKYMETVLARTAPSEKLQGLINKYESNIWYYYLPINQSELDVNKLLIQNPVYE